MYYQILIKKNMIKMIMLVKVISNIYLILLLTNFANLFISVTLL